MFKDYLIKIHKVNENKIIYLPQHASDMLAKLNLRKEITPTIDFLYTGNIGKAQNVLLLIKCFEKITNENVRLHLVGDGSEYNNCFEYVKNHKVNNVTMYGRKSKKELIKFFKNSDVCIFALTGSNFVGNTIPAKLQDYMSSGKMIIASVSGDAKKIIDESKCGLTCLPDNVDDLYLTIKEFLSNKEKYKSYGENGKQYFMKNFTMNIFINKLYKILEETK